jgi:hypothetical protein
VRHDGSRGFSCGGGGPRGRALRAGQRRRLPWLRLLHAARSLPAGAARPELRPRRGRVREAALPARALPAGRARLLLRVRRRLGRGELR